jgi:hypothetical protein
MLQIVFIRESRESNPRQKEYGRKSIVEDVIKLDTERRATCKRVRRYFSWI